MDLTTLTVHALNNCPIHNRCMYTIIIIAKVTILLSTWLSRVGHSQQVVPSWPNHVGGPWGW